MIRSWECTVFNPFLGFNPRPGAWVSWRCPSRHMPFLPKGFERPFLSEFLLKNAFIARHDQMPVPSALRNKHCCSFEWEQSHRAVKKRVRSIACVSTVSRRIWFANPGGSLALAGGRPAFRDLLLLYLPARRREDAFRQRSTICNGAAQFSNGRVQLTCRGSKFDHEWDSCLGYRLFEETTLATDIDVYCICIRIFL